MLTVKNNSLIFVVLFATFLSSTLHAKPNIRTEYGYSLEGHARIKVINESGRVLACYVGLDGWKIKFTLPRNGQSQWYKATDKRFNYKSFTTWCDYIENHPEYQQPQ